MANTYTQILRQGTYAQYTALATKDANLLYFCTDNGKLYKGSVDFTDSFVSTTSSTIPAAGVPGKIYYETDTGFFKTYIGSAYVTIGTPTDASAVGIDENSDDAHVPTSKNVYEYGQEILSQATGGSAVVKNVTAGSDAAEITVTKGDDTSTDVTVPGVVTAAAAGSSAGQIDFTNSTAASSNTVTVPGVVTGITNTANTPGSITIAHTTGNDSTLLINGLAKAPSWNSTTRVITVPITGGQDVELNLGKDIFLDPDADNHYDDTTQELVLYLNDGAGGTPTEIRIPVSGLIPIYTGTSTSTATVSVNNKVISAAVKLDQHTGNAITIASDTEEGGVTTAGGLRVDLSSYATISALDAVEDKADANTANIAALAAATTAWGSFS